MNHLYSFPKAAAFGRLLAKSKIYNHATPSSKVKKLFVVEVEKIIWTYKLSPTTINLPASKDVQEIQILTVYLRTSEISQEVLQAIDKAIPSPILFELKHQGKTKYAVSYKRPNGIDENKWIISSYFMSNWMKDDIQVSKLPVVLNMGALYQTIITNLCPLHLRTGEKLGSLASRVDLLRAKKRDAKILESRIHKEKQFNRQVELNRTLNELKAEIRSLQNG